jgi:hypothetical protein
MARNISNKSTKVMWVFCEGETEQRYFNNLRATERKSKIRIKPLVSQNKRADLIIEELVSWKGKSDFEEGDLIVCLFDRDSNTEQQLKSAKTKADKNKIQIFFSNPCFEIWILAHYEDCSSCEPKQVYTHLKDRHSIDVKKKKELYEFTKDNLQEAITRCEKLIRNLSSKKINILGIHSNPVTEVHKLIELINSFE